VFAVTLDEECFGIAVGRADERGVVLRGSAIIGAKSNA